MATQNVNYERTMRAASGDGANDFGLTVFSGVVLEAFTAGSVFYDRSNSFMSVKQLNGGVSAQWPIIGKDPASSYHTPGTFINEQSSQGTNVKRIQMFQKTITCDDFLVNALDVPYSDLNLLHFDVLGPFATKLGRNLARVLDRKIAMLAFKASLEGSQVTNGDVYSGGFNVNTTGITSAAPATAYPASPQGAYNFRKDLASLCQKFDEDNVPDGSRYLFITPTIKTALRFETNWGGATPQVIAANVMPSHFNADTSSDPSDVASRVIGNLEGFQIVMTNNLPDANYDATAIAGSTNIEDKAAFNLSKYQLKCDGLTVGAATTKKPVAVALCSADTGSPAIGMVQASGLQTYMENDERRNTKFMKAQLMCGLDTLCPWSAGSISIGA